MSDSKDTNGLKDGMAAIPLRYQDYPEESVMVSETPTCSTSNAGYTGSENFEAGNVSDSFQQYPVAGYLPNTNSYKKSSPG